MSHDGCPQTSSRLLQPQLTLRVRLCDCDDAFCLTATATASRLAIIIKSIKLRKGYVVDSNWLRNFATLTLINYEGTVYRTYIVMDGSCQRNVSYLHFIHVIHR